MIKMYGVAQRDTIQFFKLLQVASKFLIVALQKITCCAPSIVYGVAHLLYGVALSDSVMFVNGAGMHVC